jgi:predicted SprT family Zn-dependent metalloprotease
VAELDRVRKWAEALIALHLDPAVWSFGFDNAKTRAGLCSFDKHRITVSRHLAGRYEDDEIHQILLHEIAHALAGPRVGHGPRWRTIARELGYDGKRTHDGAIAHEFAPWVGTCPAGHVHYRYKQPRGVLACGRCSKRFDLANQIDWRQRNVAAASRPSTGSGTA